MLKYTLDRHLRIERSSSCQTSQVQIIADALFNMLYDVGWLDKRVEGFTLPQGGAVLTMQFGTWIGLLITCDRVVIMLAGIIDIANCNIDITVCN